MSERLKSMVTDVVKVFSRESWERTFDLSFPEWMAVLFFCFILIEDPLERVFSWVAYFDELLFIIMIPYMIFSHGNSRRYPNITIALLSMIVLGAVGTLISGYQTNAVAMLKDIVSVSKFPIVAISLMSMSNCVGVERVLNACSQIAKIFILLCFVGALVNLLFPSGPLSHDYRGGVWSFKFLYSHPTFLVFSLVMCYVIVSSTNKQMDLFKLMCVVSLALTMRDKAFGFIALAVAAQILKVENRKRIAPYLALICVIVLLVGWPKIELYLSYANSQRQALYVSAYEIAKEQFPFGGGFASIACPLSGEYYSNAYTEFGLNTMEGLTPLGYFDAGDAGLAYYLGEYGWIGLLLFVVWFTGLYRLLIRNIPLGSPRRYSLFVMFGYLVIALAVETVLTNASGVSAAFVIVLIAGGSGAAQSGLCNRHSHKRSTECMGNGNEA